MSEYTPDRGQLQTQDKQSLQWQSLETVTAHDRLLLTSFIVNIIYI